MEVAVRPSLVLAHVGGNLSMFLSLPSSLSLKSINISSGEDLKKERIIVLCVRYKNGIVVVFVYKGFLIF